MNLAELRKQALDLGVDETKLKFDLKNLGAKRTATVKAKSEEVRLLRIDCDMFSDMCDNAKCLKILKSQLDTYKQRGALSPARGFPIAHE